MKFFKQHIILTVAIALFIILIFLFFKKENKNKKSEPIPAIDTVAVVEVKLPKEYGLTIDSFYVEEHRVKNGENFSILLAKYGLSLQTVDKLVNNSKDSFDVRKIRAGNIYKIFFQKDSLHTPLYFVYEKDYENFVVYELFDSLKFYTGKKEIHFEVRTLSGIIQSSLYKTMMDSNASPLLAGQLADVYAWTIDFFGIQKGDKFKMIYEEKILEDKPIGIGRILSACFTTNGENNYAIYFEQNEEEGYFDENGKNLRRALLKAPLQFSRISSRYNVRRYHPILEKIKPHLGTDYAAPIGTPVVSVGEGTVEEAGYKLNNGNYVKIKHNSVYTTGYLHLSKIAKGIRAGANVRQGEVIGFVGSTGLATGPHLCYRFWKNGQQVDALREKIPPSEPVKEEYLQSYNLKRKEMIEKLKEIMQ